MFKDEEVDLYKKFKKKLDKFSSTNNTYADVIHIDRDDEETKNKIEEHKIYNGSDGDTVFLILFDTEKIADANVDGFNSIFENADAFFVGNNDIGGYVLKKYRGNIINIMTIVDLKDIFEEGNSI